jgi:hypothetical protein
MRFALSFLKISLKILVVVICLFIVIEIFLRVSYKNKLRIHSQLNYKEDSLLGYRYNPGSRGVLMNAAYSRPFAINSLGFPGKEFKANKRPGIYRIIVVGTSDDTGLCTDGPLNYVDLLDSGIRKSGFNAEVINCSIDGTGKGIRNIKLIKNECIRYQPDLILLEKQFPLKDRHRFRETYQGVVINYADLQEDLDAARKFIDKELVNKDFRIHLFDYSYLYRFFAKYYIDNREDTTKRFVKWMEKPFFMSRNKIQGYFMKEIYWLTLVGRKYPIKTYSEEESIKMYRELSDSLLCKNIRLVLFDKYENENDAAQKMKFDSADLAYWPLHIPYKKEYSFGKLDEHSSQEGHKAISTVLCKLLIDSAENYGLHPKNISITARGLYFKDKKINN